MDNRKSALDSLAVKLGVTTKEQWYSKTGADFLKYLGSLIGLEFRFHRVCPLNALFSRSSVCGIGILSYQTA
jgi:hypothetical protein